MEHDPDRAAATLGPRLSEMVLESPADASPTSRRAPSKRELAEILDELEGLGA
jgi:hypothetical protein